ncbi:MAG: cation transporter [Leptospiraceae bacterium]|nr:cation transporter [Leptospiraceae bacterium]
MSNSASHSHSSHGHTHNHSHDHGHHHGLAPDASPAWRFYVSIGLNLVFALAELGAGMVLGAMSLVADAGHNLSDVAALVLALVALLLNRVKPGQRFSYGLGRFSILITLINALLLLAAVTGIVWESLQRWNTTADLPAVEMMIVAGIGIIINAFAAFLFYKDSQHDLNIRAAFLHLAADTLISVGVVVGAVLIHFTGWNTIDTLIALAIAILVGWGALRLLIQAVSLLLDAVPDHLKLSKLQEYIESQVEVAECHDLHVWALSTSHYALSVHVVLNTGSQLPSGFSADSLIERLQQGLQERFTIRHCTIQVENQSLQDACC